jgi:NADPH:quinone reductase-like Zn-dependent oxidoreductase
MKAAVYRSFGPSSVVRIEEVPKPAPGPGEMLVRVVATTVSTGDWRLRSATFPAGFGLIVPLFAGLRRPRKPVLGTELAGVVEALGEGASRFRAGDAVVVHTGMKLGAHAEYRCVREDGPIVKKPERLTWDEAAAMTFGGLTANHAVTRLARVRPGERVLVTGASGAVGSAAVQIAVAAGAKVTGVASAANRELVLSLGAEDFVDYASADVTRLGQTWDVAVECTGRFGWEDLLAVLTPGGRLVAVVADLWQILGAALRPKRGGRRVMTVTTPETREGVEAPAALAEAGAFRPVVGSVRDFDGIAAAHAEVEGGHKRGSAVVRLSDPPG